MTRIEKRARGGEGEKLRWKHEDESGKIANEETRRCMCGGVPAVAEIYRWYP